ncbi:hypothetical protein GQ55_3G221600 [Panicum hallii var. hallii]|uniref:Uncharacterized protein n=1 Tax=Panicum hallii var. hallii TaxID=1504633 RepID=A0A2T7EC68_9POAL|nr:hypothetical protein GQ55_3G221600 [Panicum hallii var. hallii]
MEDLGLTVASWARVIAAVDGPASRGRRRRRRHRCLGGLGVVELVNLEPDGAGPGDDPGALLPVAAVGDVRDGAGEAAVAVVGGEVTRALRHAVDVHEGREAGLAGREHTRGRVRRPRREVAHQLAEKRPELLRLRRVLRVPHPDPDGRQDAQLRRDALDALNLVRYCCRRMLMTHVGLIEKLLNYNTLEKTDTAS